MNWYIHTQLYRSKFRLNPGSKTELVQWSILNINSPLSRIPEKRVSTEESPISGRPEGVSVGSCLDCCY